MAKTVIMEERKLPPKVIVVDNGHIYQKSLKGKTIVGRSTDSAKADLDFQHKYVSRKQGIIDSDESGYYYIDTSSFNGTYYNGQRLPENEKQYLSNGDTLHIYNGSFKTDKDLVIIVFVTDYPENFTEKKVLLLPSVAEVNIGRAVSKNIVINRNTVSENHATFFSAQRGWAIADHESRNGVFLNGKRLDRPRYLNPGDCVRITNLLFFYLGDSIVYQIACEQSEGTEKREETEKRQLRGLPLEIHIVERSVWQRAKKLMLLQNINMSIDAGEMVLILGGSGAGKTTFMNAVMGYEKAEGKIRHGDTDIYEDFESVKYRIGFVPQQDLLRGSDSVYDTLENAAEMKLPGSMSRDQRIKRVEKVLTVLGLQRERKSLVSKLSGGQKKRLSIAVEYIADPSLFFLDEPDSGLDGIMARALMQNLRSIADEGKIVMVISHAPDRAAELFDKVIVLAKSVKDNCGHLAFFGTVQDAFSFFGVDTLEEVVRRINREDEGGDGLSDYFIDKYNAWNG